MSRLTQPLVIAIVLVAPFGEGGRAPLSLAVLHTLALLVILAAVGAGLDGTRAARRSGLVRWIGGLVAAPLLLACVSALRADYPFAAGLGLWDLAVATGLFLAALLGSGVIRLPLLAGAIVVSTSLQAALAIVRWLHGGYEAAGASFLNPDHLAAFLIFGLLLCATRAADASADLPPRPLVFWAALSGLHLAAVALLMSRGALVGLVAALGLLASLRFRTWTRRQRQVGVPLIAVALVVAGAMVAVRFERTEDPYRYKRLQIWQASLEMLARRPLLGYGPGMFRHEAPRHNFPAEVGPFRYEKFFTGGHDALLTLAVENGAPAAAGLLAAAILALAALLRAPCAGEGYGGRDIALALLALLVQGLFDDLQERPALVLIPALLAGTALRCLLRGSPEARGGGAPRCGSARLTGLPAERLLVKAAAGLGAVYLFAVAVALPYLADRVPRRTVRTAAEAVATMEAASRLNPLHPDYREAHAMAVLHAGPLTPERYAQAALDLMEARRLKPIDENFPLLLGRLEALAGKDLFSDPTAPARATRLYREAARLAPFNPGPLLELAGHLEGEGRLGEALEADEKALQIEPNFLRARILETALLERLGRRDEARASFRSLAETLERLRNYRPPSGRARELAADNPAERERVAADLFRPGEAGSTPRP